MRHGHWHRGFDGWGWIPMVVLMIAFWAALVWFIVWLVRRPNGPAHPAMGHMPPPVPPMAPTPTLLRPSPAEILADRLARGEIDPDDYRARLAALNDTHPTGL